MNNKPYYPMLVSLGGLIGFLAIAWGCDALMQFLRNRNAVTFSLNHVIFWSFALIALLLAAACLLLAWLTLVRLPANAWGSLLYLLCGLFIVTYPILYYTPVVCCWLPDIKAIDFGLTMYLYSAGGWLAVIGLAGLVWKGRKKQ